MTEPTDALLPCPFCGAAPESSSCYFAFECETCGAHGPTADSAGDEAIALWNRRTPAPVGVEPVAWRVRRLDSPNYWIIFLHKPVDALMDPKREVQPLYTAPQPAQAQVVNQANRPFIVRLAEDFAEECVTAGYVTTKAASYGRLMDEALSTKAQAGAVPMYRLLQSGVDRIEAADEFLSDDTTTWAIDPNGIFVGNIYGGHVLRPARRRIKGGHHGAE